MRNKWSLKKGLTDTDRLNSAVPSILSRFLFHSLKENKKLELGCLDCRVPLVMVLIKSG